MTDITSHKASRRRLLIALSLTSCFMVIQLFGAYFSNSLAVVADAGHLFVHNSSLFIALIASSLAIRLAATYNDGYRKAELSGGLINGVLYLLISSFILFEGSERFLSHQHDTSQINTFIMSSVAAVGFLFHTASAFILYKGRKDSINVYAVFLHTFFDLLSTITTLIASIIIYLTGLQIVDLISSMLISLFVLVTGIQLIYRCVAGLFFAKPALPEVKILEKAMLEIEHILNVHNLTVKQEKGQLYVGAHIVLKHSCTLEKHDELCRYQVEQLLSKKFAIKQSVLQIETGNC